MMTDRKPVWRLLTEPHKPGTQGYFDYVRGELLDMFEPPIRLFVDIGCGSGGNAVEAKRRFPSAAVVGFEYNREAATLAASLLDHVVQGDVEQADFERLGVAPGSIDALLLADVLEHLYNPWNLLLRLRPYLAPQAQIVASIPNARNLILINELARGEFPYVEAGLLDVTHIRFFTKRSILAMFAETGYDVTQIRGHDDERIPPLASAQGPVDLATDALTFRGVDAETIEELRTIQFYVKARPLPP